MLIHYLANMLSSLLSPKNSFPAKSEAITIDIIKKVFHDEAMAIGAKLLFGLILTSIVVLSLSQIGNALHSYIGQFKNSMEINLLIFSTSAIFSALMLRRLFSNRPTRIVEKAIEVQNTPMEISVPSLSHSFFRGFREGIITN